MRVGSPSDAPAAAALHVAGIDEGFLAQLGPRFLRRLYRRVALHHDSFLLMADSGAGPVAFLAGSVDTSGLYRSFLLHDGAQAALGSLPRLVRAWPRAVETLRHGRPPDDSDEKEGELLAIAVDARWQGKHIGTALVEGFLVELRGRRVRHSQVVVGAGNASAIALYERAGFQRAEVFELHRGVRSVRMRRHDVDERTPAPGPEVTHGDREVAP